MRKEAKHLYQKAIDSLTLSIELFNRPNDCGRTHGVLIFLDHSFEMLLKASIIDKGGKIKEKGAKETIGFSACCRKGFSDAPKAQACFACVYLFGGVSPPPHNPVIIFHSHN